MERDRDASGAEGLPGEPPAAEAAPGGDPGKIYRSGAGIPVVPALDGFRAYAILGIVLFHLLGTTSLVTTEATRVAIYGVLPSLVEVLFVISGFVVFLPAVVRGGDLGSIGSYALRRGARLLPAYWLALLVVCVMVVLWPVGDPALPSAGSLAIHGAMAQVPATLFDNGFLIGFGVNGPVWTLSLEIAFYAVLPFIASAYFRRPFAGLLIAGAVTIAWKVATVHLDDLARLVGAETTPQGLMLTRLAMDNQFPAFALCFALGMTAAWLYVRIRERPPSGALLARAGWVQLASLASLAICAYAFGRYATDATSIFPAHEARRSLLLSIAFPLSLTAFILSTTLVARRRQLPFALRSSRALGDISYGIYLIHFPLIAYVLALLPSLADSIGDFATALVVAVPLTVLYGWASARFLEQPIRRWAHRFGSRSSGTVAPAVAEKPAG